MTVLITLFLLISFSSLAANYVRENNFGSLSANENTSITKKKRISVFDFCGFVCVKLCKLHSKCIWCTTCIVSQNKLYFVYKLKGTKDIHQTFLIAKSTVNEQIIVEDKFHSVARPLKVKNKEIYLC